MYKGCLEFLSFNDRIVSLYNFLRKDKINPKIPCKRWLDNTHTVRIDVALSSVSVTFSSSSLLISRYVAPVTSEYYEGTGYSKVLIDKKYSILLISMTLFTRSENVLIAYLGTQVSDRSRSNHTFCVSFDGFFSSSSS